jgi:hypothetical protein
LSTRTGFLGRCGHQGLGALPVTFGLGPLTDVEYVFGGVTPKAAQALAGPGIRPSRKNVVETDIKHRKKKAHCDDDEEEEE